MDRFLAMRTLLAAIDGGSLSAAARTLGTPLPTVSRRLSELEAHLGTQLAVRTSRKLKLTDAGRASTDAARRIVADLDEAERAAAGEYREPRGELLITAPIAFGQLHLLPIVLDFLDLYPHVDARLLLADTVVDLLDTHIDVAARLGRLPDSGLVAARMGQVRWVTVASPAYLHRRGTPTAPAQLAAHDCIAFEGLQRSRDWTFGGSGADRSITIRPRFAVNTAEALVEAAVAGAGIARMTSYQAAAAIRAGTLLTILRDAEPATIPVHLVHTGPALMPLKLRTFLDYAAPRLRASLAALPT